MDATEKLIPSNWEKVAASRRQDQIKRVNFNEEKHKQISHSTEKIDTLQLRLDVEVKKWFQLYPEVLSETNTRAHQQNEKRNLQV